MRAWAEFVLRHRRWVMVFWLVVMVAGGVTSSRTSDRMTIDFSLPGQPGTEASDLIVKTVGNGGNPQPILATVTMPPGQTITGNEDAVAAAFDAVGAGVPGVRVIDEANTGDKAFRTDVLRSLKLTENRFGIEPEITAQVCKAKLRIYELPIAYYGRTYDEGKNITWRDGFKAVYVLLRNRVVS